MKLKKALSELKALGDEKMREQNVRHGYTGDNQFGVRRGEVRKLAKQIKTNRELALELWETDNVDARFLAILLLKPKDLSKEELDRLVRSEPFPEAADWLTNYITKKHADKEALREEWMQSDHSMAARAGWALTAERVAKKPDGLDISGLLDRLEAEMGDAPPEEQWTMNFCLVEIGIQFPKHRKRAIKIGEEFGLYRDYPVSKGCTSPFAPIWIEAMVAKQ